MEKNTSDIGFQSSFRDSNRRDINLVLKSLLAIIEKKALSIAQLSKEAEMPRSSLNHYLGVLTKRDLIVKEVQENLPGKPSIIKLNPKKELLRKQQIKREKQMILELLRKVKEKPTPVSEIDNYSDFITDFIYNSENISLSASITPKGLELLNEMEKQNEKP